MSSFWGFFCFRPHFSVFPDLTRARCGTALAEGNRNRSRAGACPPGRESCCGIRLPPGETSFCRHRSPDQTASVHDVTRERDLVAAGVADGHPAGPAARATSTSAHGKIRPSIEHAHFRSRSSRSPGKPREQVGCRSGSALDTRRSAVRCTVRGAGTAASPVRYCGPRYRPAARGMSLGPARPPIALPHRHKP